MLTMTEMATAAPRKGGAFRPYIQWLPLEKIRARVFHATQESANTGDPLKAHEILEYNWMLSNLVLKNQRLLDVGAGQGRDAVVLGVGSDRTATIVSVDADGSNCDLVRVNVALNDLDATVVTLRIAENPTEVSSDEHLEAQLLHQVMFAPTVVKLDLHGQEKVVLADSIDWMPSVDAWIIRGSGSARLVFAGRPFDLFFVDRARMVVERCRAAEGAGDAGTLFAIRR